MHVWTEIRAEAQKFQGGSLTIGNFDGLHLGHQKLLGELAGGKAPHIVLTFNPHPVQVLYPEKNLKALLPRGDLVERLPAYGVNLLLELPFTRALASLSAEEFLNGQVMAPFRPNRLVVGYDFAFGKGREGTLDWLRAWAPKVDLELAVVEPLKLKSEIVSSRGLREMIMAGDVAKAREWLGRPYYVRGEIVKGAARGRTIGFPTLNQRPLNETLPALGVYASRTRAGGRTFNSVTNVGVAPTFQSSSGLSVETHLLDFSGDLYGQSVDVDFYQRLRPEMKFASAQDLKMQIEKDILEAKRILE